MLDKNQVIVGNSGYEPKENGIMESTPNVELDSDSSSKSSSSRSSGEDDDKNNFTGGDKAGSQEFRGFDAYGMNMNRKARFSEAQHPLMSS